MSAGPTVAHQSSKSVRALAPDGATQRKAAAAGRPVRSFAWRHAASSGTVAIRTGPPQATASAHKTNRHMEKPGGFDITIPRELARGRGSWSEKGPLLLV